MWRHGDWIRLIQRPEAVGAITYGRSDATINRHGIRIGTAELYRTVETLPEVLDSLVVDLDHLGRESWMPLFVVLRPGVELDEALKARSVERIRNALSVRHVPSEIVAIAEVPRTVSGNEPVRSAAAISFVGGVRITSEPFAREKVSSVGLQS